MLSGLHDSEMRIQYRVLIAEVDVFVTYHLIDFANYILEHF
jgi:hypothetical protein